MFNKAITQVGDQFNKVLFMYSPNLCATSAKQAQNAARHPTRRTVCLAGSGIYVQNLIQFGNFSDPAHLRVPRLGRGDKRSRLFRSMPHFTDRFQ
jgi:hypothetical protein